MHVAQGISFSRRERVAGAGLYVFPPAVVSPAKANQMALARVITGQTHRLHHRLGAAHVERHRVLSRYFFEPLHVIGHARVVGPQHHAYIARNAHARVNT